MSKRLGLKSVVMVLIPLSGAGLVSARAAGTIASVSARLAAPSNRVQTAAEPSRIPVTLASRELLTETDGDRDDRGDHDRDNDRNRDRDRDHDRDRDRDNHDPTPEPSTLLSFGAALLIGGGVLYSRRLRGNRK